MKTFTIDGKEYCLNASGKIKIKVPLGKSEWGAHAWVDAPTKDLVNPEVGDKQLSLGGHPKIPEAQLDYIAEFFSEVYEIHRSEAFVYFSLNADDKGYTIIVPPSQTASPGGVSLDSRINFFCTGCYIGTLEYEPEECAFCGCTEFEKARLVGTAHSHGSMRASHSSTDDANELHVTGFHITFGCVDKKKSYEICPSFVTARLDIQNKKGEGIRFVGETLPVEDLIEVDFTKGRQKFNRWTSLVISQPALSRLKPEDKMLVVDQNVVALGEEWCSFTKLAKVLKTSEDQTSGVFTKLAFDELIKEKKKEEEEKKRTQKLHAPYGLKLSKKDTVTVVSGGSMALTGSTHTPVTSTATTSLTTGSLPSTNLSEDFNRMLKFEKAERTIFSQSGDEIVSVDRKGVLLFKRSLKGGLAHVINSPFNRLVSGLSVPEKLVVFRVVVSDLVDSIVEIFEGINDESLMTRLVEGEEIILDVVEKVVGVPSCVEIAMVESKIKSHHKYVWGQYKDILRSFDRSGTSLNDRIKVKEILTICWLLQEFCSVSQQLRFITHNQGIEMLRLIQTFVGSVTNAYSELQPN